jgi:beta-mannosidase
MRVTSLNDTWTLFARYPDPGYWRPQLKPQAPIRATVPGHVHLDLIREGIIADPFRRRYEIGAQWVDETDWLYSLTFQANPSHKHQVLRFECLDTIAEISLNGEPIETSDNFFMPVEVDITGKLKEENELQILFRSAVATGVERRREWFATHGLPTNTTMFDERAFVRKPGYMFGWDWGPRLVSAGIAGEVSLLDFDEQFGELGVTVTPDGDSHLVAASAEGATTFEFLPGNDETQVSPIAPGQWRVKGPLWWPRGMGDQPLHEIRATLGNQTQIKKIGLRTIELIREPDAHGESFEFRVNGEAIWARGANWIPNDSFPSRITPQDYEEQIQRFADLNFNMLRVWGGGLYESEAFYDACDRHGILVWQDFPYACMYYPDDESWQETARKEAEHHVRRLRHRASLALWCGNNENLAMWQQKWGPAEGQPDRYYGGHIYDEVLPAVVKELSPATPYIASSPIGTSPDESIPISPKRNVGMDGFGDSHYWDVWHGRGDWRHYRESSSRFSSEFGFASACSLGVWEEILTPAEMQTFPNPSVLHHDKTGKAWETFYGFVALHYPEAKTLEEWTYYSQLNQRDAFRFGIEHYRRSEFCRGTLIWQANDCWPVQSWAVQDYSRRLKPAGFDLRRLYEPLLISVNYVLGDEEIAVWVCNDGSEPAHAPIKVSAIHTGEGDWQWSETIEGPFPPRSATLARAWPVAGFPLNEIALRFEAEGIADRWLLLGEPKNMRFGEPKFTAVAGENLEVTVEGFVADLVVWDAADHDNIRDEATGQPGWSPVTGHNTAFCYRVEHPPKDLKLRSLWGAHEL